MKVGALLRIKPEYRNPGETDDTIYKCVEDNGDRLVIELANSDLPLNPQEVIPSYCVTEIAEESLTESDVRVPYAKTAAKVVEDFLRDPKTASIIQDNLIGGIVETEDGQRGKIVSVRQITAQDYDHDLVYTDGGRFEGDLNYRTCYEAKVIFATKRVVYQDIIAEFFGDSLRPVSNRVANLVRQLGQQFQKLNKKAADELAVADAERKQQASEKRRASILADRRATHEAKLEDVTPYAIGWVYDHLDRIDGKATADNFDRDFGNIAWAKNAFKEGKIEVIEPNQDVPQQQLMSIYKIKFTKGTTINDIPQCIKDYVDSTPNPKHLQGTDKEKKQAHLVGTTLQNNGLIRDLLITSFGFTFGTKSEQDLSRIRDMILPSGRAEFDTAVNAQGVNSDYGDALVADYADEAAIASDDEE